MKQLMLRERRKKGFKQPKSLFHLSEIINAGDRFKSILKGFVWVNNDSAIIFSSNQLLNQLNREYEIYIDGMFKVNITIIIITEECSNLFFQF